jgi:transposase InsO family protein
MDSDGHPRTPLSRPGSEAAAGHRLRSAVLLGSTGQVASSVHNTMMESFWSTMQRERLDRRRWSIRAELGAAIFEWIEGFYNARRRHFLPRLPVASTVGALHTAAPTAA